MQRVREFGSAGEGKTSAKGAKVRREIAWICGVLRGSLAFSYGCCGWHWEIRMGQRRSFGLDAGSAIWKAKEESTESVNHDFIDLWTGNESHSDRDEGSG